MIHAGASPKTVRTLLGHSSAALTLTVWGTPSTPIWTTWRLVPRTWDEIRTGWELRHRCRRAWGYAAALHPSIDVVAPSPALRSLGSPHSSSISRSTE
jgi:hypothetical protein